ncbi:MAG: hypothetical protein LQ347_006105 [Umbilicaria vellea]|nr:MAG: hypothetical protein LQ347_006105 [Umbilicaria vellea]
MASLDIASIIERLMKLSTVSLIIWLAGFFALFQSFLNALAEIMRFGDREFYTDWWNSPSVGTYWKTWNKPVYHFMKRHIYSPLIGRGWTPQAASVMVFVFSGILHELLVGVPTHNIIGVAFVGMIVQIPLIAATLPLEKMQGINGKIVGNCIFWISFCLVGQPLAALLYFFAWQAKYGSTLFAAAKFITNKGPRSTPNVGPLTLARKLRSMSSRTRSCDPVLSLILTCLWVKLLVVLRMHTDPETLSTPVKKLRFSVYRI